MNTPPESDKANLMTRNSSDTRMKALEARGMPGRMSPDKPIYARIDGRNFSRFTHGMQRPLDTRMSRAMIDTARWLLEETSASTAYVQSDEISLLWGPGGECTQPFFGGRVIKTASILSGMATARFITALINDTEGLAEWVALLPHFDARVCQMPTPEDAADMIVWRGKDAERNAIQMVARTWLPKKSLHGVNRRGQIDRLREAGILMTDYPDFFRNGTLLSRVRVQRPLDDTERTRIPPAHRPAAGEIVERTTIHERADRPPHRMANLVERLFISDVTGAPIASPGPRTEKTGRPDVAGKF